MKRYLLLLLSVVMITFSLSSQTIKELEARKKKALDELAMTNKLLQETQKSRQGTVNQINLLKRSIKQSQEMINALNSEISLLDGNIDSLQCEKKVLQTNLEALKQDYAAMVCASYFQRKYFSPIMFVLASEDFNQAFRRFRYLQEMTNYRKEQSLQIMALTQELQVKEEQLIEDKLRKETAMSAKALESQRLERQNSQQATALAKIKKKENDLKAKQKKQQQQANQLNNRIQELIAAEIKKQNAKKGSDGKSGSSSSDPYKLSKEEQLVAGNFEKNKGKLPLPVEKGFISGKYGVQPHPVLSKVTINNKGVYIQTPAGSDARAIFEGEVTQIFSVQGSNSAVIVKHGNYRTVYSNLTQIYVKVGDKVQTKQKLGKIFTDKEDANKTELYLMIYRNTDIQNPEHWLAL